MDFSIDKLLAYTLESGASDLHLSAGSIPMVRIHGDMKKLDLPKLEESQIQKIADQVLNANQRKLFDENLEIDFSTQLEGRGRFRVNIFQQLKGVSAVFRTIPDNILSTEELGIPPLMNQLAEKEKGLILMTGPTGSGKSTTLAAMIDHLNDSFSKHIITIEDPVEYFHHSRSCLINQRELGQSTHSFANALRSALREDPDVILVGEMRDLETIQLALTAAETGHLVLSTLHTSSAVKTIDRIIDVFPADNKSQIRSMLSESLIAVVAQKLLKLKGGGGRVPVSEIMIANTAVKNLIREDKIYQIPSLIQSGSKEGMQSLDMDLQRLLRQGKVEKSDVIKVAENPDVFEKGIF